MKQAAEREAAAPRLEEAMSPAARAPPHAIGTPAVARSARTWGRPPFQVKTPVGCSGFCSAHGLPVAAGNASGGGSAAGRHLAPVRHLAAGPHLAAAAPLSGGGLTRLGVGAAARLSSALHWCDRIHFWSLDTLPP